MASEASFDIVSKVDMAEVTNAVHQATKEIGARFDLKDTGCDVALEGGNLVLTAPDDLKLRNVYDVLFGKLVKRNVPVKNLEPGKVESALGGTVRQEVVLRQGLDREIAKKVQGIIKDAKLKVQAQVQEDQIRVTGKNKDDLQAVIKALRGAELPVELQFVNYR